MRNQWSAFFVTNAGYAWTVPIYGTNSLINESCGVSMRIMVLERPRFTFTSPLLQVLLEKHRKLLRLTVDGNVRSSVHVPRRTVKASHAYVGGLASHLRYSNTTQVEYLESANGGSVCVNVTYRFICVTPTRHRWSI